VTSENALLDSKAELQKAHASLRAAQALASLDLFDDAASRVYYAAFHLVSAALLVLGIQAQTHAGIAMLLGQHLVKPGLLPASVGYDLASLFGLRSQADYNRHFTLDAASMAEELARVIKMFGVVETFLAARGVSDVRGPSAV
jgi:uncharacterized protein (UPF0332 family)